MLFAKLDIARRIRKNIEWDEGMAAMWEREANRQSENAEAREIDLILVAEHRALVEARKSVLDLIIKGIKQEDL